MFPEEVADIVETEYNRVMEAEAIEEGEYVQNLLHTKANDFPVYIVSEYGSDELDGRADQLGAEERTQYIVALADKLKSYGYRVGVYATQDWFTNNLIYETLVRENLHIWIANEEEPVGGAINRKEITWVLLIIHTCKFGD